MKTLLLLALILAFKGLSVFAAEPAAPVDALAAGFAQPPAQTKPWCYYYWISDNISKEGITKDLEAMQRVGIGEALIGNIFLEKQPVGRIKVLSEEWWQLIEHAIREGSRLGVNIGLFNCPGWSQSGGPWIQPTQTMRHVISSEIRVTGPRRFVEKLSVPKNPFQDIAVLAFPAPRHDGDALVALSPRVTVSPAVNDAEKLIDGDSDSIVEFPAFVSGSAKEPLRIDLELAAPLTARSLQIIPGREAFGADAELQCMDTTGQFQTVRRFKCDRSNAAPNTGFMPRGPVTISFPATTSRHFRLVFTQFFGRGKRAELAEINLSGAARLEAFVEKQLGEMHNTPLPNADTYVWSAQAEADSAALHVPLSDVRDLTAQMTPDGTLTWDVPAGEWVIQRTGMTPTGMKNSPASPEGQGLEVDKMNRAFAQQHFDAFVGELLKRMPAAERKAFTRVVADSYEMGSQNWTDGMDADFRRVYDYDPKPWLPVLSGRIVGSAAQSERFLWDLRRLVADRVATDYVGGLNAAAKSHGLGLWLENYGHWGFPGEFLKYGGQSDRIAGEFWVTGNLGSIECRAASSAANTYGQPFVSAESFTGGPPFQSAPSDLKARGDWSFTEGINHVVLHVVIQQPTDDKIPGINAPWGTEFNRHNTWFEQSKAWIDYERRSSWLLQQGWRVTDVAYFIGEDAPKMTGERVPELPVGRDFDYINAEVIEKNLSVKDGLLVLPHGVSYRVLVLPKETPMRPTVLRKIRDLVKAGATVLGLPPTESPSLQDYPRADAEVREIAAEIWGAGKMDTKGERAFGQGRVVWGKGLAEIFAATATPPDIEYREAATDARFLFTHRSAPEAEIYFVSNQKDSDERVTCAFRVSGRQPELWDAVTGERRLLPEWSVQAGQTLVPLRFAPKQSWFVVFRQSGKPTTTTAKNFPEYQPITTLEGAWEVAFDPKWGGPAKIEFATLSDWTKHAEDGVRHYSGKAVYRKNFDWSPSENTDGSSRVLLDLGEVRDVATVSVNGRPLATLWIAPWRVDVTDVLNPGANQLEVEIINVWNNRLVGDQALPVEKRLTSLSLDTIKSQTPLLPAGLLGPVTLQRRLGN